RKRKALESLPAQAPCGRGNHALGADFLPVPPPNRRYDRSISTAKKKSYLSLSSLPILHNSSITECGGPVKTNGPADTDADRTFALIARNAVYSDLSPKFPSHSNRLIADGSLS